MCGIFLFLRRSKTPSLAQIVDSARKIKHRGPDNTHILTTEEEKENECKIEKTENAKITRLSALNTDLFHTTGIFHRLAINGLTSMGDQPFVYDTEDKRYYVFCNGEIYNYKELIREHKLHEALTKSRGDCYVIGQLFMRYREETPKMLKGEFSFFILEYKKSRTDGKDLLSFHNLFVATDRLQKRPLFCSLGNNIGFCSELKGLTDITTTGCVHFPIASYMNIDSRGIINIKRYYNMNEIQRSIYDWDVALTGIRERMINAVRIRVENSEQPIGFLVSGGLDSSLVFAISCWIQQKENTENKSSRKLRTFTIGLKGGTDLINGRMVADFFGSDHTEIIKTEEEALAAIEKTVYVTESYDKTTIRASIWQYMASEYISEHHPEIRVLLIGDGSDELLCGYRDCYRAPTPEDAHLHTIKRLEEIHYYDAKRADRAISYFGIEARFPFLDEDLVEYVLSIDPKLRIPMKSDKCDGKILEKLLIRDAFQGFMPDKILYRKKEAFSDGVSGLERSWFQVIGEYIEKISKERKGEEDFSYIPPDTKESLHYRRMHRELFGKQNEKVIPGYWLQAWSPETTDPSARTMTNY